MHGRERGQRVHHVVPAEQRPAHFADLASRVHHDEGAAVVGEQARAPVERAAAEAEGLDRRPAAHRQHFGRCLSSPLTINARARGTVRTRWWNWRWIAATSGKMSAWSYSRLLRIAVRGR